MAKSPHTVESKSARRRIVYTLDGRKRSAFERVASLLIALLAMIGMTVVILLITWLTMQIFVKQTAVPVQLEEIGTGDGNPGGGSASELEPPPPEEMNFEPPVDDPLPAITSMIASNAAVLDDPMLDEPRRRTGTGRGTGRGVGDGTGDGTGGRPRHWEVQFPPGNTLQAYAKQLDGLGIELGILMPENKVLYAFNFSKPKPDTRVGATDAEKRYYLTWRRGRDQLAAADRDLLTRAGVAAQGKIILKFIPTPLELELLRLEKERAKQRSQTKVRKTVFQLRSDEKRFTFFVYEQTYE